MKNFLLAVCFCFLMISGYSQCTWNGATADWNTGSNWSGLGCQGANVLSPLDNTVPTIGDAVTIPNSGVTPEIGAGDAAVAASININTLATLNMTGGTLTLPSTGVFTVALTGSFNMSGGDFYINKDVGSISDANAVVAGFVATGGTVHFQSNTGSQVIDIGVTYPHISIDGGALVTTSINLNLDNLTVTNNSTFSLSNAITYIAGMDDLTVDAGSELILTGTGTMPQHTNLLLSAGKVSVTGSNKSLVDVERDFTVGDLMVNLTAGQQLDIDNSCDVIIANDLTITSGILDVNTGSTLTGTGGTAALSIAASGELELGGTHSFPTMFATPTLDAVSTVDFYGSNQNVGDASYTTNFGNVIVQGTGTKTLVGNIQAQTLVDVRAGILKTGAFSITGTGGSDEIQALTGTTLDIGSAQFPTGFNTVDLQSGSLVEFTAAGNQILNDDGGDDHVSFYDVYLEGSGTKSLTAGIGFKTGGNFDIGGDANVASGISFDTDANDIELAGTLTFDLDGSNTVETSAVDMFSDPTTNITETISATSTYLYNGDEQDVEGFSYGLLTMSDAVSGESAKLLEGVAAVEGASTGFLLNTDVRFQTQGFAINTSSSSPLTLADNAIFEIDGTDGDVFPTGYDPITLSINSTVDYGSTLGQVIKDLTYGNLTLSGAAVNKTITDNEEPEVRNTLDIEDNAVLVTNGPTDGGTDQMIRLLSTGDAANQTAKIANLSNDGGGTITGTGVICERDMDLAGPDYVGWNDWASPIENFRLANWYYKGWPMTGIQGVRGSDYPSNPFCSVLTYNAQISTPYFTFTDDEVVDKNDGWVRGPSITTTNSPGTGFRLYTGARDINLEDIGNPSQGNVLINLNYEDDVSAADSEEGWNLVGNPYMCAVDFDLITKTGGNIVSSMWMYSNVSKGYFAYNSSTTTGNDPFNVLDNNVTISNGYAPSHKSFWVKVTATGQSLTFEESDKVTSGTAFVKQGTVLPKVRVQVQNVSNGFLSAGVIVQMDAAEQVFEQYDSEIFKSGAPTAPNLFFLSEDDKQLSINSVPSDVSVIPMQVEAGVSGVFELRFYDFNDLPTGTCISLEDKFTQEWFDVREEQSIIRNLIDTTSQARFNVHVSSVLNASLQANTTCYGTNDGQVMVENFSENVIGLGLYDEAGKLLYEDMVTKNKVWKNLKPGVYTVREVNTNVGCPSAYATVEVFEPNEVITSFEQSVDEIDLAFDGGEVSFTNTSIGATEYIWFFSDDNEFNFEVNPTHVFNTPGIHDVSLLAHNGNYDCATVYENQIIVKSTVGIAEELLAESDVNAQVIDDKIQVNMAFENPEQVQLALFDVTGKEVGSWNFNQVTTMTKMLDLPNTSGLYILKVKTAAKKRAIKLLKR